MRNAITYREPARSTCTYFTIVKRLFSRYVKDQRGALSNAHTVCSWCIRRLQPLCPNFNGARPQDWGCYLVKVRLPTN